MEFLALGEAEDNNLESVVAEQRAAQVTSFRLHRHGFTELAVKSHIPPSTD
jgi:hypothetical protein